MVPGVRSVCFLLIAAGLIGSSAKAELMVGAAVVDITPNQMPVLVNGGMLSRTADEIRTRINARAIVIANDDERIALVVLDSCMVPKEVLDAAKQIASKRSKIKPNRMMVSATHTHTAPSSFGALGTNADPTYVPLLREKIAESIVTAESNLQPAKVGWGSGAASEFTAVRRWIRRPDRLGDDPFGNPTVRANMHSAKVKDDVTGPSGPEDPELSMIAFRTIDGQPIAVLANFSMHYFGDKAISADYFGLFSEGIATYIQSKHPEAKNVVGVMSHGCSGDIWRRDYFTYNGNASVKINEYTQGLLESAKKIYDGIEYQDASDLAMAETRLPMKYRVPDQQRLEWAKRITETIENDLPSDRVAVYAREQVLLDKLQTTSVVVQAIRIGNIGIATTPNETYALTGLKIKNQSPLEHQMVIELANGADGYIPPPEQHHLGGYNTWAARSAGLEVQAEPRIAAASITLLEQVSGKPRRPFKQTLGAAAKAIMNTKPIAYWRTDEMQGPLAKDSSGMGRHAAYEPGVVFFLEGPSSDSKDAFVDDGDVNRCAHFAGGRLHANLPDLGAEYSIMMSVWNGMPIDARETLGWFASRDHNHTISQRGDHFGIGGTATKSGAIIFQHGNDDPITSAQTLARWTWNRITIVRSSDRVQLFINGQRKPAIDTQCKATGAGIKSMFIGGRSDNDSNWEGRIDEVAIFDRVLTPQELEQFASTGE